MIFKKDKRARHKVGYEALRAEAEYQSQDPDAGKDRPDVDADDGEAPDDRDDHDDVLDQARRHGRERLRPLSLALYGVYYQLKDSVESYHEGHHQDKAQYRLGNDLQSALFFGYSLEKAQEIACGPAQQDDDDRDDKLYDVSLY